MLQSVITLYNKQLNAPTHFWEGTCSVPTISATGYSYTDRTDLVVLWATVELSQFSDAVSPCLTQSSHQLYSENRKIMNNNFQRQIMKHHFPVWISR